MIDGYSQMDDCSGAFGLFRVLRGSGLKPDEFTLSSLLSACAQSRKLKLGKALHHYMIINRIDDDLIASNALLDMYGKCNELVFAQMCFNRMSVRNVVSWTSIVRGYASNGLLDLARRYFEQMRERSIVSWNAMMDCYNRNDEGYKALDLYERMRASGIAPDEATLVNVLSACSKIGNHVVGERTHDYIVQNIGNPSITLQNSIIDMYGKCGHIDIAFGLFNSIETKNVVSWNVMIGALAIHGHAFSAVELFRSMESNKISPDSITFVGLLSACSHGGLLELGQHYFKVMDAVYNIQHEIEHYACMVDLFGRRGCISRAIELIRSMAMKPDVVIWGALLGACKIHGDLKTGMQIMKQMLELENFNSGLFVLMSNLFCKMGRWDDVMRVRKLMNGEGVKKVEGRSSIEICGKMHEFLVGDFNHESSCIIYFIVDQLMDHLQSYHHQMN